MQKYLILEFRNAGLFRKHRNTRDKMFDLFDKKDRKDEPEFVEPITVYQISNMLHVLFGERPKPINRETCYDSLSYIFDKALNSYIKIDSYKDKKDKFASEKIQLKKSVWNSWAKQSYMNWSRVKKLLEEQELIDKLINTLSDVFNCSIEEIPFDKVVEMLLNKDDERIKDLFVFLNKKGKKPLYDSIYGNESEKLSINANNRTQITVVSGLDSIIRLKGQILVPVSDDDIEKIRQNKGCATILDGGLVYIKSIESSYSINTQGFKEVKQISLEKQ